MKLTPKEEAYCLAIIEGLSSSDAYRKAYKPQRAKTKTIHEKASRIMAKGKVRARIAELMAPVIAQAQMTRTEWLRILTKCCRFDPRKLFDATGKLKPITELEENEAAAIEQHELHAELPLSDGSRRTLRVKMKFSDRLSAGTLGEGLPVVCGSWGRDRRVRGETYSEGNRRAFRQAFDVPSRRLSAYGYWPLILLFIVIAALIRPPLPYSRGLSLRVEVYLTAGGPSQCHPRYSLASQVPEKTPRVDHRRTPFPRLGHLYVPLIPRHTHIHLRVTRGRQSTDSRTKNLPPLR